MNEPVFVSNSSPIIAFEHLNALDILHQLTNAVYVPPAVRREVFGPRVISYFLKSVQMLDKGSYFLTK
jgi:predicted nucleic acid-binding protein